MMADFADRLLRWYGWQKELLLMFRETLDKYYVASTAEDGLRRG